MNAAPAGGRRRLVAWGLRLLGPVVLIVVLLRLPAPSEVVDVLARAAALPLAAGLALNVLAIHLKVVRWQVLLRTRGIHYGTKDAWFAFSSSLYLAMLTPGRVGDVLRIQYLRHDVDAPYSEGLASVVMDRLCDLYVLVGFVAVALVHYSAVVGELRIVSWAVVALTTLGPLVLVVPGVAERLLAAVYRRLSKDDQAQGLHQFLEALRAQVGKPLLVTLPLTVVSFLVAFGQAWFIARSIGLALPFFDVICLMAVANLMGLLPISVSGVGIREAFFALVFPSLGYTASQGVGFGFLVFLVVYLALAAIGFVAWQIRPPPTGLSRRATAASGAES